MGREILAISRRDFLQLTAKSAIYSSAFLTGCAPMATDGSKRTARAIDIHHHYFPAELINEIKQHGKSLGIEYLPSKGEAHVFSFGKGNRTGVDPEIIDVDKRLEVMRDGRVAIATAESQPSAQGYSLDGKPGEAWSRLYNEGIHNLVKRYPQRFVGMATVPLQDPVRAASVLDYAIRELKFSGVTIGSNVNGKYFDGKEFDPFWKKAEELQALVFLHPQTAPISTGITKRIQGSGALGNVIGNPLETSLALAHLIFQGTLDRFPNVKICAAHGGGFLPSYAARMDHGCAVFPEQCKGPTLKKKPSDYLKQLYFDSLVFTGEALRHLVAEHGASQIMIGTDYAVPWAKDPVDHVLNTPGLSDDERIAILGGNAAKLIKLPS